jgi:pimeloyl-ACP methyl ester carboxylesterase
MTDGNTEAAQDCVWEVDGLRLAGRIWGPADGTPVLALHGWMDHADSFHELAPRLAGCRVVALDLSGQGLSDHRAAHATYNIWDDLPQIAELLDLLGWQDCVLLGHSRGANIAGLFAAAQPDRVRALIALDSLVPEPDPDETIVTTLTAFIEQTRKQKARPPRLFPSSEAYIERRTAQGNARRTSEALAARALEPHPEGVRMRGDPRLFARSAVKLKQADVEAVMRAWRCPVLNLWATDGIRSKRPAVAQLAARAEALVARYETAEIAGDHHFHLEPAAAGEIAEAVRAFLDRHGCR